MAQQHKVLGQSAPLATTPTTIYTVPAVTQAIVSSIFVCNRGAAGDFRIAVRKGGAVLANQHYIYYDIPIPVAETFASTTGIALEAGDILTVYASTADMSFTVTGVEIT